MSLQVHTVYLCIVQVKVKLCDEGGVVSLVRLMPISSNLQLINRWLNDLSMISLGIVILYSFSSIYVCMGRLQISYFQGTQLASNQISLS